jgi:3-oxoacyl-[acyl-carrier-protein] synthase-3
MYVPERVVTNADLSKMFDTNDEWIVPRTGIRERRYMPASMTGREMAGYAAEAALGEAGLQPDAIDAIVAATLSPDYFYPGNAALLQQELGLYEVPTYDVRNQCSGFVYALSVADQFVRAGTYRNVLVVGSEIHSTGMEFADRGRDVSVIFGDGAGAFVLTPETREGRGILSSHLHGDGANAELLWTDCEGAIYHPRFTVDMIEDGSIYPTMRGKRVFMEALRKFPEAIQEALAANGVTKEDVDCYVFHQANLRITESVLAAMEVPIEKSHNNIDRYGNTTAASIPIAFHEAKQLGKIKDGSLVMIVSFGSGFTWGSVLLRA